MFLQLIIIDSSYKYCSLLCNNNKKKFLIFLNSRRPYKMTQWAEFGPQALSLTHVIHNSHIIIEMIDCTSSSNTPWSPFSFSSSSSSPPTISSLSSSSHTVHLLCPHQSVNFALHKTPRRRCAVATATLRHSLPDSR